MMSIAKRCDKCGKFYTDNDNKFQINGVTISYVTLSNRNGWSAGSYDLCDDCARDLFHWLCNEQEYEVEEE